MSISNSSSFVMISHTTSPQTSIPSSADIEMVQADNIINGIFNPRSLAELVQSMPNQQATNGLGGVTPRQAQSLTNGSIGPVIQASASNDLITLDESKSNGSSMTAANETRPEPISNGQNGMDAVAIELLLKELREENDRLRNIVEANNTAMRKQITIVQNWKTQVLDTRVAYETIKQDMVDKIEKLENQKSFLESELEKIKLDGLMVKGDAALYPVLEGSEESDSDNEMEDKEDQVTGTDYYWDDLSMDLGDLTSRLQKMNLMERMSTVKQDQLDKLILELTLAKDTIKNLEEQIAVATSGRNDLNIKDERDHEIKRLTEEINRLRTEATKGHGHRRPRSRLRHHIRKQQKKLAEKLVDKIIGHEGLAGAEGGVSPTCNAATANGVKEDKLPHISKHMRRLIKKGRFVAGNHIKTKYFKDLDEDKEMKK